MPTGIRIPTRVPPALALVLLCWAPRSVPAADADLAELPPELAAAVERKLAALDAAEISADRMRQKLREGRAKNVPAERIAAAVTRLGDNLLWANAQLRGCELGDRDRVVEVAAELLFDSLPQPELEPTLRHLCRDPRAGAKLGQAAELYSFLVHKLAASPPTAWAFAFELLRRGEDHGTVHRLIPVLQEIHRSKRAVDRPLRIAVVRLRTGASVRAVRNELRDQFLSRGRRR